MQASSKADLRAVKKSGTACDSASLYVIHYKEDAVFILTLKSVASPCSLIQGHKREGTRTRTNTIQLYKREVQKVSI